MGRGLTTAAKQYTGPIWWAAIVTTREGITHNFAQATLSFLGDGYQGYLGKVGPVRLFRSLRADAGTLEFNNADRFIGSLLETENWEGARVILKQLLVDINEEFTVLAGILTEQEEGEDTVSFRVVSSLDAPSIQVPPRKYAQVCTWRFGKEACGYVPKSVSWVEHLAETDANQFGLRSVGNTGLNMPDHKDRTVVITAGTGKGQKRRIVSNDATTLTVDSVWETIPDLTSKFAVFAFTKGAPKVLFEASSGFLEVVADIFTSNTIGRSTLAMAVDEHAGDLLQVSAGLGAGKTRKIISNTATTITHEGGLTADGTSVFRVLFTRCPKDYATSCQERARTFAFNGFPTVIPTLADIAERLPGGTNFPADDPRRRGNDGGRVPIL